MAYPDLEESNRSLQESFARNPVSSGPATPAATEPDPSVPALFRGESSATPPDAGPSFSQMIDERTNARLAEQRGAPAVTVPTDASRNVRTGASATQTNENQTVQVPRGDGRDNPNVIADAVGAPAQAVTPYDRAGDQAKLDVLNRSSALRAAGVEQDSRNAQTAQLASTDRLQAGQDLVRAESEARVARFRAANGADVILSGPGRKAARESLGAAAYAADANVAAIKGRATAPAAPTGNVLADALAQREALSRGQLADAASTRANSDAGLNDITGAVQKQKLDQEKRISAVGQSLLSAKTPKDREAFQKTLLAMMGKDSRKNYQTTPFNLPKSIDPVTGAEVNGGQAVLVTGDDGSKDIVRLDGGAAPKAAPTPNEFLAKAKADPRNGKKSDQELMDYYNKNYGPKK